MITIIDYGVGNLRSVQKAFEFIGAECQVSSDPQIILSSDAVVLPGVGAFAEAMEKLCACGLDVTVRQAAASGKPFLGICLGMQLLFDTSEEGGPVKGLGILPGTIRKLPDMGLKIPHMGWNQLVVENDGGLFSGLSDAPYVYFVHSFYLDASLRSDVAARSQYGITFDVAVSRGNIHGTQFHPEKSGDTGLTVLRNFVATIRSQS